MFTKELNVLINAQLVMIRMTSINVKNAQLVVAPALLTLNFASLVFLPISLKSTNVFQDARMVSS